MYEITNPLYRLFPDRIYRCYLLVEYNKSKLVNGSFTYTFPGEIMLDEGSYYVELEFLENFFNELFVMKSKPLTGKTRYRYASQSAWKTLPSEAPIYIEYDSVE